MGPIIDIQIIKSHFAEYELIKDAIEHPKSLVEHQVFIFLFFLSKQAKKIKNVEKDDAGGMLGQIYIGNQDISKIKKTRVKALKRSVIAKTHRKI